MRLKKINIFSYFRKLLETKITMEYNFKAIEARWQKTWKESKIYQVDINKNKPKFYVLDMFPYPSGAGLHVGHPLGYIASDIYSRYKRHSGFNVLHPMGYDAFGLPAEQYAIQTGQHPAITTDKNIKRYREQLDRIGFSYDWSREVKTCDPSYYKWTQWAFIQMFKHWYNNDTQKAEPIENLILIFEQNGNESVNAACSPNPIFNATDWTNMQESEQQNILFNYRIAYLADAVVNWCPALGTVLANDEVREGYSIRGGHPVVQKTMKQWQLRISAYAQRLLDGLETIDWTDSLKEVQRNWIGRSEGAEINFKIKDTDIHLNIFTTRPDTIFGVSFMVLAPESEWVEVLTSANKKNEVFAYIEETKKRSERERIADVKRISGVFTGSYAIHPFSGEPIPVWVSEYVLAGYGTGAIMAVPAHDQRDYDFAKHFNLPIKQVIDGGDISEHAFDSKDAKVINSDFITGLHVKEAIKKIVDEVEKKKIGKGKINYKLRDAIFSRQRYWGEPFPIYYKNNIPYTLNEKDLPLCLPEVDAYLPTEKGEPPLARAKNWQTKDGNAYEYSTMPGFAGSSAYYFRYMDPQNNDSLVSKEAVNYWQNVDLYIGGTEHATGHLIYSRFWCKFLFDIGLASVQEPFKKLINQGMIQGRSNYVYRLLNSNVFISKDLIGKQLDEVTCKKYNVTSNTNEVTPIHIDIVLADNDILDINAFKNWRAEFKDAQFILNEEGKYVCGWAVEKMSKSMFNVVNPDDIIEQYGADTLRLYEMFLGPIEQSKPWDTKGIEGVHRFLRKFWRLYFNEKNELAISNESPTKEELKVLHKTIKKVTEDINNFAFNTSVSSFMICVNELSDLKCNKKDILEPLCILLAPFAPHISEEIWNALGNKQSIVDAPFPLFNKEYLIENNYNYPVSFNGKTRFFKEFDLSLSVKEIETNILQDENTLKWLEGKEIKKVIIVPKKIINIVC
jgi:leucyl-tRNA synthetase